MPDSRLPSHRPDGSTEDRFLRWVDHLVDPTTGATPPPDPDFTDIAETAHTIHRAAGLGARIPPSPLRADAIWESLMHTSTASAIPVQPGSFNGGAPLAKPLPTLTAPQPEWRSYLLAAALIAAIVITGAVALWRITDPLNGRDPDVANQPGVIASSTPATGVQCDLTSDIPVFAGSVPDPPFLDTYLLLDDNGALTLNCAETSEAIASGVTQVEPTSWPATIVLVRQDRTIDLLNLTNGAMFHLESDALLDETGRLTTEPNEFVTAPHSPWLVTTATADHTDWRITDLRTMESFLLSDEVPEPIENPHHPRFVSGLNSWNDIANGDEVAAIAFLPGWFTPNATPPSSPDEITTQEAVTADGNVLLLPGPIEDHHWIDVVHNNFSLGPSSVSVSLDGSLIAYPTSSNAGEMVIRVEQTDDGTLIAEIPLQGDANGLAMMLTGSTPRLIITTGETVEIVSWDPKLERTPVDIDPLTFDVRLYPTADPDVVLLEQGGGAMAIDVTEGTVIGEFQYVPYLGDQLQFGGGYSHIGNLVTIASDAPADVPATVQIVDPVTGEILVESDLIDVHPIQITQIYGVTLVRNGALAIVPLGSTEAMGTYPASPTEAIVLDAESGETWQIDVPSRDDTTMVLIPSPDGQLIYATPARNVWNGEDLPFFMTTTEPGAEWIEVSPESAPQFIIGTHGLPIAGNDEPAVLEAQQITPLEASPDATPATPVASGCDLTHDILVVTDLDTLPWDRTTLLHEDGTLSLHCDGTSTVVAEGVAGVWSTYWPCAVITTTEDGTLHGVNLLTGATGDLGPANVLTESISPDICYTCAQGSPWLVIPGNTQLTDWRIVDLKTMESLLLSDVIGGVLPTAMLARNNTTGDTPAVITFPGRPPTSGATPAPSETRDLSEASLPSSNAALVIDGSLGNHRWTETSSVPQMSASVSHDDSLLALAVPDDRGMTVSVEQVDTGELVAGTGIDLGAGDGFFVLDDGAGLLHLTDDRLDLVTWQPELANGTLLEFETGQGLPQMFLTANPDVIIVSLMNSLGESVGYLVNTSTGEIIEVPGLMRSALQAVYSEGMLPRYVLAASPAGSDGRQSTIRMIDVTTGNVAVESDPVEFDPAQVALRLSALRAQGTIGVSFYKPGHAVVLNALTGETFRIEAPANIDGFPDDAEWYFYPSPDGAFIEAGTPNFRASPEETRWFVRRLSPESEWIETPSGSLSALIVGSHALP